MFHRRRHDIQERVDPNANLNAPARKAPARRKSAMGGKVSKAKRRPGQSKAMGSSNAGEYPNVAAKDFAGPSGGALPGTYPVNTIGRARAALAYASHAPKPQGIRNFVYKKYPKLKP